jgi:hypothetical protein
MHDSIPVYVSKLLAVACCPVYMYFISTCAQVHGPHINSVAAYEQQCADIKWAKATAWAARKQKAAARKAQKLAKQQVRPSTAPYLAVHAHEIDKYACLAYTYLKQEPDHKSCSVTSLMDMQTNLHAGISICRLGLQRRG